MVEEGGQSVIVKLWDEHADVKIDKGQKVLIKNLRTSVYHELISLNSTDETSVAVCVSAVAYLQSINNT